MKSTRESFGEKLVEMGDKYKDLFVVDADLSSATKTEGFAKKYPERFINVGIAEQDLIGFSSGLSQTNKRVVASSFATFLTGRAYDIIRQSIAYTQANVKLVATHAGLSVGEDGATHQMLEDISLMRTLPNMEVYTASDDFSTKVILENILNNSNPTYLRLYRNETENIYDKIEGFEFNKGFFKHNSSIYTKENSEDNKKVLIITMGDLTNEMLKVKSMLEEKNISTTLLDVFRLKPIEAIQEEEIYNEILKNHLVVVIEDHSVYGGLYSIIAELFSKRIGKDINISNRISKLPIIESIGMKTFGKSDKADVLYDYFGFSKEKVFSKILEILNN